MFFDDENEKIDKHNASIWESLAKQHINTGAYEPFLTLKPNDIIGDWALKWAKGSESRIVSHLGCHLGIEAIAWSRAGFSCIGVDRSKSALKGAVRYSKRSSINDLCWCQADIGNDLPFKNGSIDLLWLSYGSIYWYSNFNSFMNRIVKIVRPNGMILIQEMHPISLTISTNRCSKHPTLEKYSFDGVSLRKKVKMEYAGGSIPIPASIWIHSMGDIINSAISNGLKILEFQELNWTTFKQFPFLISHRSNYWAPQRENFFQPPLSFRLALKKTW